MGDSNSAEWEKNMNERYVSFFLFFFFFLINLAELRDPVCIYKGNAAAARSRHKQHGDDGHEDW